MDQLISMLTTLAVNAGGKILLSIVVFFFGRAVVKNVLKLLSKSAALKRTDGIVHTVILSSVKIASYSILFISIIGILGVPMASVVTVLASAGVAVGLALQGALSNLAGGIMLMIFKPFQIDHFVSAAGVDGVVKEVTLFYTVFLTPDNKRITVPNGSLMNANVVDYSSEPLRRVDLTFSCAKGESPSQIQDLLMGLLKENEKVLSTPEPFARLSGGTNESLTFTVRVWCKSEDYWDIYYDLTQKTTEAFAENHIAAPAIRILTES